MKTSSFLQFDEDISFSEVVQTDDVISFEEDISKANEAFFEDILNTLEISSLFRSNDFLNALVERVNFLDDVKPMLIDGIPCRMMTPRRKGWTNGKIKLKLEFTSEENRDVQESKFSGDSLDEIRNSSSI